MLSPSHFLRCASVRGVSRNPQAAAPGGVLGEHPLPPCFPKPAREEQLGTSHRCLRALQAHVFSRASLSLTETFSQKHRRCLLFLHPHPAALKPLSTFAPGRIFPKGNASSLPESVRINIKIAILKLQSACETLAGAAERPGEPQGAAAEHQQLRERRKGLRGSPSVLTCARVPRSPGVKSCLNVTADRRFL